MTYPTQYILDENGQPIPEDDPIKWGQWYQKNERHVAEDIIMLNDGMFLRISTVFLALDHGFPWREEGLYRPILWETMVFYQHTPPRHPLEGDDWLDLYQKRYHTREEAADNHERLAAYLRKAVDEYPGVPFEEVVKAWCDAYDEFEEDDERRSEAGLAS